MPVIKAVKNPTESIMKSELLSPISPERISLNILPNINGTTIKNENLADFSLSTPSKTAVEIVAPEREIPGTIAIACEIPMIIDSFIPTLLLVAFDLSANKSKNPVIASIPPTKTNFPLNKDSISVSNKKPTIAAGIIESIILKEKAKDSLSLY